MAAHKVVLGISAGTRSIGLAIIRNGDLVDWKVKTFKGEWSKEKQAFVLRRLEAIWEYCAVTAVAMKKIDPCKSSRHLDTLCAGIMRLAQKKHTSLSAYSLYDLHSAAGGRYRSSKKSIADYVLDTYPKIRSEYLKERNNRREYYGKMFEAVLCAHLRNKTE